MKQSKIFVLTCNTFGRKFSFHAKDLAEAEAKRNGWCSYHSLYPKDFPVAETDEKEPGDLHDEYVS